MFQDYLQEIRNELVNGTSKKGHPYKYFTLATINDAFPGLRTVVLRKTHPDFKLTFYTDSRTQKVTDIKKRNQVSALFYHPKKMLQLRLEGEARIVSDVEILDRLWRNIPENSRKDYTTNLPPGSIISSSNAFIHNTDNNNFCAVDIVPHTIEYLKLQRPNHEKIQFSKDKHGDWKGEFLVP